LQNIKSLENTQGQREYQLIIPAQNAEEEKYRIHLSAMKRVQKRKISFYYIQYVLKLFRGDGSNI
jgi:hypothetical protein